MRASRVLIVQAMCKHYRAPLFARMHEQLAAENIELRVAYSQPGESHRRRNDDVDLPSAYGLQVPLHAWLGDRVCLQLPLAAIWRADLVIVEHALKHVINYPLSLLSCLRIKKLGFWTHGGTLRLGSSPLLRPIRTWSMLAADWVFAYTKGVAATVIALGARPDRVTALQNAIDVSGFRKALAAVGERELKAARIELGLDADAHVALFCGSLYPGRGVDFLVKVGDALAQQDPSFALIVLGDGPLRQELEQGAGSRPWLHLAGSIFGDQRAVYFRLAQLCVMPYLIGLGVLDALAAGLPLLVTGARSTNPEIEYLVDGVTGLVTGDSVEQFAGAIHGLFANPTRLQSMHEAASAASHNFSIETMAQNFCDGICVCLAQPRRRQTS